MSTPEARCVWLTESEARLAWVYRRWLNAPADPVEAVADAICEIVRLNKNDAARNDARTILAQALGYPDSSPRQEEA